MKLIHLRRQAFKMTAEMKNSIKNLKAAKRYSKALLEISEANETSYEELNFVSNTIETNPPLRAFILNPVVSKQDKADVLAGLFKGKISDTLLNFTLVLNDESRLNILNEIISSYENDINKKNNTLKAEVTSAIELNDELKNSLIEKLQNKTGKKIIARYAVDKGILGGIIVKINDTVIDLSIKKKLENLKFER